MLKHLSLRASFRLSGLALVLSACALGGCGSSESSTDGTPSSGSSSSGSTGSNGSTSNNGDNGNTSTGDASRAIAEADIIQMDGGRLYAMSKSGTVSIVDVSQPGRLALLGQTTIAGQPFEMYLRGNTIVAMTDAAFAADGSPIPPVGSASSSSSGSSYGSSYSTDGTSAADPNTGAAVVTLDVSNPNAMTTIAIFPVPGQLADSRIVGDVLYLATYENSACYGCGAKPRTMVTTFNVADPTGVHRVDQMAFQSDAPDGYNLPWGSSWKRSIIATTSRLYIGGHADIDPADLDQSGGGTNKEGIIDVVDITDPSGKLVKGSRVVVAGAVLSRWQMDEQNGVLRVISQRGAGRTGNGLGMPEIATFTIASTQDFEPLGFATLSLPRQEGLRTVRFDTDRAYAITYNQTDPLFTIDLTNPAAPIPRGQLSMPGFMFYLEPHGDRVIGLGVDRNDPGGSLNVSLFDVSNLDSPKMIMRTPFGAADLGEDYEILSYELPEDQDRIQKAFKVFDDGLVAVPFSSTSNSYTSTNGCTNPQSGVQIVEWSSDTLTKRATLHVTGNPRRAIENSGEMLTVSDSNVTSFHMTKTTSWEETADLTIGTCVDRSLPGSTNNGANGNNGEGNDYYYDNNGYPREYACSTSNALGSKSSAPFGVLAIGTMLGIAIVRRRKAAAR